MKAHIISGALGCLLALVVMTPSTAQAQISDDMAVEASLQVLSEALVILTELMEEANAVLAADNVSMEKKEAITTTVGNITTELSRITVTLASLNLAAAPKFAANQPTVPTAAVPAAMEEASAIAAQEATKETQKSRSLIASIISSRELPVFALVFLLIFGVVFFLRKDPEEEVQPA